MNTVFCIDTVKGLTYIGGKFCFDMLTDHRAFCGKVKILAFGVFGRRFLNEKLVSICLNNFGLFG